MLTASLLWTGGLDSTYRLCELSRLEIEIQPYYLRETRRSMPQEIHAMEKIRSMLLKDKRTIAKINEPIFVDVDSLSPDEETTEAWLHLRQKYSLGTQYEYLARFARQYNLLLEIGLESSPRSKATTTLLNETEMTRCHYDVSTDDGTVPAEAWYLKVDPHRSSPESFRVFENLVVPARLFTMTKTDEVEEYKRMGLFNVAKSTWFCHTPILGLTCGRCGPCMDALNEGLEWRVSRTGTLLSLLSIKMHKLRPSYIKAWWSCHYGDSGRRG